MSNTKEISDLLTALGNTPDEVAAALANKGIKGTHLAYSCPVANYLAQQGFNSLVWPSLTYHEGNPVRNPDAVYEFVHCFDNRHYPELEEEET